MQLMQIHECYTYNDKKQKIKIKNKKVPASIMDVLLILVLYYFTYIYGQTWGHIFWSDYTKHISNINNYSLKWLKPYS